MKKYRFFWLFVVMLFMSSCSNLLDEKPYGVYSNSNYYNTEADAISALLYAYSPLSYIEYCSRFLFYMGDITTNQYKMYGKAQETNLYNWDVDANTDEFLYFFKYCYISIGRANSVLENVVKMDNIDSQTKNQILGEAYFLRAFNYFMLVKNYGSVPYRNKVVNSSKNVATSNASIEDIYGYIIKDLEQAISMMGISKCQGRADKVGAEALLSKVYLTMASSKMTGAPGYDWVKDYESEYKLAANWANEVLTKQTVYSLDPDLTNVYDVDHQADGPEHIFITAMTRDGLGAEGTFSQLPQMFGISVPNVYISAKLNGTGGVKKFYNSTGGCWSVFRVDNDFYKSYSDNDLRKNLMVSTIYDDKGQVIATYNENNINDTDPIKNAFFYPFCRKYTDYQSNTNKTSANVYLIRFAEVALTYAEAVGPTEDGYKWINAVRNRANLPNLQSNLSVEDFRKAVWDEVEHELAFEGHGLYELRRTNRVMEKITNKKVKEAYAYFFPIPQREIDLNNKN
jgi:hypothetical protein